MVGHHSRQRTVQPRMTMPPDLRMIRPRLRVIKSAVRTGVQRLDRSTGLVSGNISRIRKRLCRDAERQDANQGNQTDRIGYPETEAHQEIPFSRCNSRIYWIMDRTSPLVNPSMLGMLPKFQ